MQNGFNKIYQKRGLPFNISDYPPQTQKLIKEKLLPVDEIVKRFPKKFNFFSSFAMGQARGLLRNVSIRNDYEDVKYFCAMSLEPYKFFKHPNIKLANAYFSPFDRFISEKMGKTVAHLPRQYIQFLETIKYFGLSYISHACTVPDEEGYVNLGLDCGIMYDSLNHFIKDQNVKVILEINRHIPWVQGHKDYNYNRIHLSQIDYIYENHEPCFQLPTIIPAEIEKTIAENVVKFINDGDAVQLGIGGIPNYIATKLLNKTNLKIHSEMLSDSIVDLANAGVVNNHGKGYMDGITVGTFALGTDKLYNWLDRNPSVMLLPVNKTNDPYIVGQIPKFKSVNSSLMIDLNGQVCSDAVGFQQISGIGGQLEFVMGAQKSTGGKSILCIKSTSKIGGKLKSNILTALPFGSPVTVTRHYADTIITEYGCAEIKHLNGIERARALIDIAHPAFRNTLIKQAKKVGLYDRKVGFTKFSQRAIFNNFGFVFKLKSQIEKSPKDKLKIILSALKDILKTPNLLKKIKEFYRQNKY